ncbi:Rhodanese-like protein [Xylariomycetidae sp. FL0641]|nr:Rhodanese-like protein [Xylariomycetidae sp. FL0641]
MAPTPPPTARLALRSAAATLLRRPSAIATTCRAASSFSTEGPARLAVARPRFTQAQAQARWSSSSSSSPATKSKLWTFEEISDLTTTANPHVTLIDTREPAEIAATGRIPGSVNLPIGSAPDGFHLPADEFAARFGFARPPPEQELVVYCKAGVRSRAAAGLARDAGYQRVGEYPGSWLDWSRKGGKVEKGE